MTTQNLKEIKKLMEDAGKSMGYSYLTDDEVHRAIIANGLVLSYFESRGEYFGLITSILRIELAQLKGFQEARK